MRKISDDFPLFSVNYLHDESKQVLKNSLDDFRNSSSFTEDPFTEHTNDFFLQGDIINNIPIPYFDSQNKGFKHRIGKGLLLSNTCDMSEDNKRYIPMDFVIAPLISIDSFKEGLISKNIGQQRANDIISSIKKYEKTETFYLPIESDGQYNKNASGAFAKLDAVFSLPKAALLTSNKLNSMNQFMHYLLTFKISYHFSRLQERVDRHMNTFN